VYWLPPHCPQCVAEQALPPAELVEVVVEKVVVAFDVEDEAAEVVELAVVEDVVEDTVVEDTVELALVDDVVVVVVVPPLEDPE
jgi:hypothetical protein